MTTAVAGRVSIRGRASRMKGEARSGRAAGRTVMGASTCSYEATKPDQTQPRATGAATDGSTQRHSREVDPRQGSGRRPVAHGDILTVPAVALAAHAHLDAQGAQLGAVVGAGVLAAPVRV